jgi:hypothetical protein
MSAERSPMIRQARRCGLVLLALWLFGPGDCRAQNPVPERSFAFPETVVTRALMDLDAYSEGRLPGVDGFVALASGDAKHYGRPSYRFRIETNVESANRTRVKVQAGITAWFEASGIGHSGYVSAPSNGRLEDDLLDRLEQHLDRGAPGAARSVPTLNEQISQIRSRRQSAQQRQSELQVQIRDLEKALKTSSLEVVTVQEPGLPVMDAPTRSANRLVRAGPKDEFEIVSGQGEWYQVRVGPTSTGWLRRAGVVPIDDDRVTAKAGDVANPQAAENNSTFEVTHEEIQPFSGNWSELRGKQSLFVWVQPARGVAKPGPGERWTYATRIFLDRGYVASVSTQPYAGVAVIFDEPDGGVVAATLDGIRRWHNGTTATLAFQKQCSMDPPAAFINVPGPQLQRLAEKPHASISQ